MPITHVKRSRLPTLERNILKYRAFEMAVILFYAERLKTLVRDSIRATDAMREDAPRLPEKTKRLYHKAWSILVQDGILTEAEKEEIEGLVDYRNEIAHAIHDLTYDLGQSKLHRDYRRFYGVRYRHNALKRLKYYWDKIERGLCSQYVVSLSFDKLLFEPAEKTYEEELARLHVKIVRQMAKRRAVSAI
jgi:uncharacterized protein YutE (UPF0331/DUF86 family)